MSVIKTENLKYVYGAGLPGATTAVNGINIEIEKGEFVGVIGPTGCGKSTLITHFNGLLRPTEGNLYIDGVDIWAEPSKIRQFRFKVGLVFQYPEYQLFEETIYKDISFGPKNMGLPEDEIHARVMRAAKFVGLSQEMMERSPFELSGGQKRRVAIAGVLAMEPEVLVLDEPAAGLDPEGREMILSQVKRYHKETGTTVVLVSHSMEDIAKFADRVLVLQAGEYFCTCRRAGRVGPFGAGSDQNFFEDERTWRRGAHRRLHRKICARPHSRSACKERGRAACLKILPSVSIFPANRSSIKWILALS